MEAHDDKVDADLKSKDITEDINVVPRDVRRELKWDTPITSKQFIKAQSVLEKKPNKTVSVDIGKLPSFDKTKDEPRNFIKRFQRHLTGLQVPIFQWPALLLARLNTVEADWLERTVNDLDDVDWDGVKELFISHFEHFATGTILRQRLMEMKVESTVADYCDRFTTAAAEVTHMDERDKIHYFKGGLGKSMLNEMQTAMVAIMTIKGDDITLDDYVMIARALDANSIIKSRVNENKSRDNIQITTTTKKKTFSTGMNCDICKMTNHTTEQHNPRKGQNRTTQINSRTEKKKPMENIKCYDCGESGVKVGHEGCRKPGAGLHAPGRTIPTEGKK